MIYNREESEVAVLGEVQKHKVGIDERNINHIVTILSSNLYSYPMISFLREIVSNAVDSHIEAGTEEPIIIYRTEKNISIRDYGTGISPERFAEIYLNIGSSTKRESNDYIGSFGIGRFSSLAVADICNITSFYNGKAYYYVMNKDVDQLHIDLMDVLPTMEHNGVEVKIPLDKWDVGTLICLSFIDNLYVETEVPSEQYDVSNFNKRKIYSYKNFKLLSYLWGKTNEDTEILLGQIPYKVDYNSLWDYDDTWHKSWKECFKWVFPQLEIGQIDITPNREGLLYSERTKKALQQVYDACIEELTELWNNACSKEYEDIREYMNRINSYVDNTLILNDLHIPVSKHLLYDAAYKNYPEWSKIEVKTRKNLIGMLLNREVDTFARMCGDTLHQGSRHSYYYTLKKLLNDWLDEYSIRNNRKVIALPSKAGFSSQYFKGFVREKFGDGDILFVKQLPRHFTSGWVKHFIKQVYGITTLSESDSVHFIIQLLREILLYLKDKVVVTDIMNSPEYAKYKKDHAEKKSRTVIHTENICFTITACAYGQEKRTETLSTIIPYIRRKWGKGYQIVYADLDNPFIEAFGQLKYPRLIIISAAKGKMPLLKEGLPQWVKPIETLYSPDNRILQKYATMKYIMSEVRETNFYNRPIFPKPVREAIVELKDYKNKYFYERSSYSSYDANPIIDIVPEDKYDRKIMALYHYVKKYLEIGRINDRYLCLSYSSSEYGWYFLMKNKKFRIDWQFYRDLRSKINILINSYENNKM